MCGVNGWCWATRIHDGDVYRLCCDMQSEESKECGKECDAKESHSGMRRVPVMNEKDGVNEVAWVVRWLDVSHSAMLRSGYICIRPELTQHGRLNSGKLIDECIVSVDGDSDSGGYKFFFWS